MWGKSEWQAVRGPVQVDVHAWLSCTQTGEMTRSLAKMFTGRCVLKESSLAGHGSGKYPAVQRICNTPLVHGSTYKNPDLLKRNDGEAGHALDSSFSLSLSFFHSLPPSLSFFPYHWTPVYVRLKGKFFPPFAPCFTLLLSLVLARPEPLGSWLLCSGSRQKLRFVMRRWHEQGVAGGCSDAFAN